MSSFNARRHFAIRAAIARKAAGGAQDAAASAPKRARKTAVRVEDVTRECVEAGGFDQNERLGYAA